MRPGLGLELESECGVSVLDLPYRLSVSQGLGGRNLCSRPFEWPTKTQATDGKCPFGLSRKPEIIPSGAAQKAPEIPHRTLKCYLAAKTFS